MTAVQTLQRLYRMQTAGEIPPEAVAFFNWMRWQAYPAKTVSGSHANLAARYSPRTKASQVKYWLKILVEVGVVGKASRRGENVPRWVLQNGGVEEKNASTGQPKSPTNNQQPLSEESVEPKGTYIPF